MPYPCLPSHPTPDEIAEHFTLSPQERELVGTLKKENWLGFAVLLKTYEFLGHPPLEKTDVPSALVLELARQLGQSSKTFRRYPWKGRIWKHHRTVVRKHHETRSCRARDRQHLREALSARGNELLTRARMLDAAVDWCRSRHLELPAEAELRRLVHSARRHFFDTLFQSVYTRLEPPVRELLDRLFVRFTRSHLNEYAAITGTASALGPFPCLVAPLHGLVAFPLEHLPDRVLSTGYGYDRLKQPSSGKSGPKTLLREVHKLEAIRAIGIRSREHLAGINPWLVGRFYKRARREPAGLMRRHAAPVRCTLLAALLHQRGMDVTDGIVRMFLDLIHRIQKKADKALVHAITQDVPNQVYSLRRTFHAIALAVTRQPEGDFEHDLFPHVPKETFEEFLEKHNHKEPSYEVSRAQHMREKYARSYRRELKKVLELLTFRATSTTYQPLLEGIELVRRYATSKRALYPKGTSIPEALLTRKWPVLVWVDTPQGPRASRHYFELCVLHKLERALRCKEVWVEGAYRFRNPDEDMPTNWAECRTVRYDKHGFPLDPQDFLRPIQTAMKEGLAHFDGFLGGPSPDVTIQRPGGGKKGVFKVPKLEKRPERPIIQEAKARVLRRWGMQDLLNILLEADQRINFLQFFHTSGQRQVLSTEELRRRLLLVIFSLGTNIGPKRLHAAANLSCSYAEFLYFCQRYLDNDGLRQAIIALTNYILVVRNPKIWGNATTCASDGKYLSAWDQNLVAEWNPHYHGLGVMVYWHVEKNSLCIYSQTKAPSSSEVAAMVEGLVRHDCEMRVERNFVDSHGQSEVAFAFCKFLGIELNPRLKRIKHERLYLPDNELKASLPRLKPVLERSLNWDLFTLQYDDLVRHVVALKEGTGPVESILRRFNSFNRGHPTYRAALELGKAQKIIFLCKDLSDPLLRQERQEGLNVVENWNGAIDFIRFGRKNEFQTNDPEQMERSILCLHLLVNAIVLVNTLMLQHVLAEDGLLARFGPRDFAALMPLFPSNINPFGAFALPDLARPSFLGLGLGLQFRARTEKEAP